RTEAAAVMFWWGVFVGVVWRWPKVLGVGRMDNHGSRRLTLAASAKGADTTCGAPLQPAARAEGGGPGRRCQLHPLGLSPPAPAGLRHAAASLMGLLGTASSAEAIPEKAYPVREYSSHRGVLPEGTTPTEKRSDHACCDLCPRLNRSPGTRPDQTIDL